MAKNIGANGFVHALIPMLLLLQIATLAQAEVDITLYKNIGGNCQGAVGYGCYGIHARQCCSTPLDWTASSVKITASSIAACLGTYVYRDGGCSTTVYTTSSGNMCLYGGTGHYTGASWFNACARRRSLLTEVECNEAGAGAACTERVEPTAVTYTEDAQKGDWILEGSNVTELYSQLMNVHDGEKVNWLKSQGATYRALDFALKLETHLND